MKFFPLATLVFFLLVPNPTSAQSQALDGQIEGTVTDTRGSVIPHAVVTVLNGQTGAKRTGVSNESGIFRFPILSLGTYAVTVEVDGFNRFEQKGIVLNAGHTASITVVLQPGSTEVTVTVTADAAIADASRFEVGRSVSSLEVKNLPLVSRNPYNFALLQPGVNGRMVSDPSAIKLNANGFFRRAGYQIDGGYNNEASRGGFRLNLISETFVKEVQLLTGSYSAEFGNTVGAIVNVVTPSGTNNFHGDAAFLFQPVSLSAKPFGFVPGTPDPNLSSRGVTATIDGPFIKDRWHFFAGYERTKRKTHPLITIRDSDREALIAAGLRPSIFSGSEATIDPLPYFILRTDAMSTGHTRLSFRYNRFDAGLTNALASELDTTERSFNNEGFNHAFAAHAVTSFSATFFNEFRFQYAKSIIRIKSSINSASGVSVTINGMANFGPSPMIGSQPTDESTMQLQNAVTRVFQKHSWKIGGGVNLIHDNRGSPVTANYTFGSIADYRAAVSGPDRRTYLTYDETFGNNAVSQRSKFLNLFIQDYWDVSTRLKIALGLRYDLFHPPAADPASPLVVSRKFNLDKNNLAPRLGVTYLLRDGKYRTVIRAGSGLYYDAPFLDVYRRAVINNGSLRFFKFSFQPGSPGAPEFPHTLGLLPAGTDPVRQDIDAVSPDFATLFAMHSNFQIEQSLAENWSFTAGYLHTSGRHIPVYSNVNCRPIGGTLADGRPLFGTVSINAGEVKISGCTLRIAPEFQRIMMAESVGNSNYNALFLQLTKRLASGFQLNASYTLARARDDAPEQNVPGPLSVSDPSNRSFDRGTSVSDVRHTLALSMVLRPKFSLANGILRELLNHNQIGLIALANSGETFNITTVDLNRDGVSNSDRPVGIGRNAGRLPAFYNLDARISRFFSLLRDVSLELYAEGTNMLNRKSVFSYDSTRLTGNNLNTSQVNPLTGEIRGSLPDFKTLSVTYQGSRQLQFGIKFHF